MKAIVRFFRQRAIKSFLKKKKNCVLPDITKYPTVAVMLDAEQFKRHNEIEKTLSRFFTMKRYTFIVCCDEIPENVAKSNNFFFITKKDFDFWGLIRREEKYELLSMAFDMLVDFTKTTDELMTNNYVMTLINNSFRVRFGTSSPAFYDLVIDTKKDDDMLNQIEILYKYLSMLLGRR